MPNTPFLPDSKKREIYFGNTPIHFVLVFENKSQSHAVYTCDLCRKVV